uniref:Polyprotein n=1 Tax=Soybean thrips iflavirus 5 TaxID=2802224 RepID=A0A7T8G225_9VIRU|nr:polyprotein [Soybean thrips iflavirus 5]
MDSRSKSWPPAIDELVKAIKLAAKDHTTSRPYTIALSNWLNSLDKYFLRKEERKTVGGKSTFHFRYELRVTLLPKDGEGILIDMIEDAEGLQKIMIEENIYENFCLRLLRPYNLIGKTQMDTDGQEVVDKESNVILQVDDQADLEKVVEVSSEEINKALSSTEKPYDMIGDGYSMMNRWYPLQQVVINTESTDLFNLKFPEALYKDSTSVNLLPLRGFIYGDLDVEVKLVVNAAPFHAGRIIMGIFYCAQGYNSKFQYASGINVVNPFNYDYFDEEKDTLITTYQGMVQRPHVLLDMAESTTASMIIKYNYNKPYVRLLDYADNKEVNPGIMGGRFVNLKATMISKLQTGQDQPKSVNCSLFYRFIKARLTAMTRQHELVASTQMDVISAITGGLTLANEIVGTGVAVIDSIERQLTRKGKRTTNRDKPSMQFSTIPMIPRFRNHFPNGVGIADTTVMGIDAKSLTTHYEDTGDSPKSYNELARMPGILTVTKWDISQTAGVEIFSEKVVPYDQFVEAQYNMLGSTNLVIPSPVPLHVASNGFMYWSGTIIYEFDFVKTPFHKGLVMISINFGKKSANIGSNYEKIVDIQQTNRVKITVPYIYDVIARRTNNCSTLMAWTQPAQWHPDALPTYTQTTITLTVMNPLINVDTVANNIGVVIWKYGGKDFTLNTPCQVNNIVTYTKEKSSLETPNFPVMTTSRYDTATTYLDNLPHISAVRSKRSTTNQGQTQGDIDDFVPGIIDDSRFHTGDDTNFKNLLRVPIKIISNEKIDPNHCLCLPVTPLSIELIRWYLKPRLSMTHQSQIVRMFRMWRGTLRYTIVVNNLQHAYITYLPADGTWKKFSRDKHFAERIPGTSGQTYNPLAPAQVVKCFYDDQTTDLAGTGNFTTMILPSVNPSEQIEIPWNLPVNWALMNQGDLISQQAYRDISNCPNGHVCIYGDQVLKVSVFLSVGDDFEMGAFCGLTDNIVISKGIRMDDCRLKTQMDFQFKEIPSDGYFSEYYTCEEENDNMVRRAMKLIKKKQRLIKPLVYGATVLMPYPIDKLVQGLLLAHTLDNVENRIVDCATVITGNEVKEILTNTSYITSDIKSITNKSSNILNTINLQDANEVLSGCKKITHGVSDIVGRVQGYQISTELYSWLTTTFAGLGRHTFSFIENIFYKIMHNLEELDFKSSIKWILESLTHLGFASSCYIKRKLGAFYDILLRIFNKLNPLGKTQILISQNELDIDLFNTCDVQNLVGLIMGGLISVYGVSAGTNWQHTFKKDQIKWTNDLLSFKTISGVNSCITFVKNIYSTMMKMMIKVLGINNEEIIIREALSNSSSIVSQFCTNAQEYLNDFNNEVMGDPIQKSKFWITICNAYQIQASLCKIKGDSTTVVLKTLCRDVIRKSNESMSLFKASCVRYEPFVICLEGASGIGKSFLTTRLSVDILNNLGLKMPTIDFRYNVSAGVDYWNLYNGQPIIVYDDWCNMVDTQSIRKEISELYQLKTSNVMNAPKAELSEKKTVVNPFGVLLATNNPFPNTNTLIDHTPLYRRRDVLVKVQLKQGVDRSNPDSYKNFQHLEFAFYDNSYTDQRNFTFMNFENFRAEITRRHTIYHQCEASNVKSRIAILSEALHEQALVHKDIEDPFTLQARSLYETDLKAEKLGKVNSLPSEVLNFQVMQLIDLIEENFKIVGTENNKFIIRDSTKSKHMVQGGLTQGFGDTFNTYFISPIIKTYNTLYSYLTKWLHLGYYCSSCSRSAINTGVCLTCKQCDKYYCGWCYRANDAKCRECSGEMESYSPPFFDMIIAFVCQAANNTIFPTDWKSTFCAKLIGFLLEVDTSTPLLMIGFMLKALVNLKDPLKSGPIPVKQYGLTQIGYDDIPGMPSNCRITSSEKNGECLAYSIWKGLEVLASFHDSFSTFKKKITATNPTSKDGWYETETHAVKAAELYSITIHLIEKLKVDGEFIWSHSLITKNGVKQVEFMEEDWRKNYVHVVNFGEQHFQPILMDKIDHHSIEELNANIIDNCIELVKEEKVPVSKFELSKPATWWYAHKIHTVGNELHCNHIDFTNIPGGDIIVSKDYLTYKDKNYSFTRCNPECILTEQSLQAIVEKCFYANELNMKEKVRLIRCGLADANDDDIPEIFRSPWMQEYFDNLKSEIVDDSKWFEPLISKVLSTSFMGGIALAIYYFFKSATNLLGNISSSILKFFFGNTQSEDARNGGSGGPKLQRLRKTALRRDKTQANVPNSEHYNNIKSKIIQNYVIFKTDKIRKMIGIGIYGSTVVIPKHYIAPLQKANKIELQFYQAKHETMVLNPANLRIKYFVDKDCALVTVSKAIYFTDIRKFFMPQDEYENYQALKSEILVPKDSTINEHNIRIRAILEDYEAYDDYTSVLFKTKGALEYDFEQRGACGSLILTQNKNHPIVGIHVAGHEGLNRGVGARLCREELGNEVCLDFPDLPYELTEEGILDFGDDVNVEYLGRVSQEMTPFLPNKSNIEKSLIDSHFETPNKVQPAILSAKDPRYLYKETSPLVYGVKKHGKPTFDFDSSFVEKAFNHLKTILLSPKWSFPHTVKIYDLKTAALGLKECSDYYDWLPDSTSAGWPYNTYHSEGEPLKTKKKYWMQYIRDDQGRPTDVVFDPLILEHIDRDMKCRKNNELAPIVFQDVLKDEKRLVEKLLKPGGTRVFSMSPINASLVLRQYSLDLTSYLRENRIRNWIGIGINPDGPEWGKLVTTLKTKGNNIFTIDYSNFGPGLNIEVASFFKDLMKSFYNKYQALEEGDENVIDSLIYELMYSVHLAGGTLYRTKSGSPSGAAITCEINSFTHLMYVLICWQIIGKVLFLMGGESSSFNDSLFRKQYDNLFQYFKSLNIDPTLYDDMDGNFETFQENVIGLVYGDDGIFSVKDAFKDIFNAKTIAMVLENHGICATDATKSSTIKAYGPLEEASFLKRSFTPHPIHRSEWLAPILDTSIEECARWIQRGQASDLMTMENAKASLLLAYGQGPKYYKYWSNLLNKYLTEEDLDSIHLTWENIDQMFYPTYYNQFNSKDNDILEISKRILTIS